MERVFAKRPAPPADAGAPQFTALTGRTGLLTYNIRGVPNAELIIDRNGDDGIDEAGDKTAGLSNDLWEYRTYAREVYGASYIRWADLRWRR